jgi:hypothetical protein
MKSRSFTCLSEDVREGDSFFPKHEGTEKCRAARHKTIVRGEISSSKAKAEFLVVTLPLDSQRVARQISRRFSANRGLERR